MLDCLKMAKYFYSLDKEIGMENENNGNKQLL